MFQQDTDLRTRIFETLPESIEEHQGITDFKGRTRRTKTEQRSLAIKSASSLLSPQVVLLQFPVNCSSFDLLCHPLRFSKTCFDPKFSITACSNSLNYPFGTDPHSSMKATGVSEMMAKYSDCGSMRVHENICLQAQKKCDHFSEYCCSSQKT